MSERERWIVYPLLFLALGAALRDKLFDQTISKRIVCQELQVVDEPPVGQEPVLLARIGRLETSAPNAQPRGLMLVNGQLSVTGVIDSNSYQFQGYPLVPRLLSMADVIRAIQQSAKAIQRERLPDANRPQPAPPPGTQAPTDDQQPADDAIEPPRDGGDTE